mmetsp:Transcript_46004/g.123616  ORF Transcript_46004/g.123616 Transcript_46004/m.123616 type:complete len:201 (-) Transcript_46004:132-734(-)
MAERLPPEHGDVQRGHGLPARLGPAALAPGPAPHPHGAGDPRGGAQDQVLGPAGGLDTQLLVSARDAGGDRPVLQHVEGLPRRRQPPLLHSGDPRAHDPGRLAVLHHLRHRQMRHQPAAGGDVAAPPAAVAPRPDLAEAEAGGLRARAPLLLLRGGGDGHRGGAGGGPDLRGHRADGPALLRGVLCPRVGRLPVDVQERL